MGYRKVLVPFFYLLFFFIIVSVILISSRYRPVTFPANSCYSIERYALNTNTTKQGLPTWRTEQGSPSHSITFSLSQFPCTFIFLISLQRKRSIDHWIINAATISSKRGGRILGGLWITECMVRDFLFPTIVRVECNYNILPECLPLRSRIPLEWVSTK